jgi:hypothetical protein
MELMFDDFLERRTNVPAMTSAMAEPRRIAVLRVWRQAICERSAPIVSKQAATTWFDKSEKRSKTF